MQKHIILIVLELVQDVDLKLINVSQEVLVSNVLPNIMLLHHILLQHVVHNILLLVML